MNCTIHVAKTKALISLAVTAKLFAVTAKLICAFVFASAEIQFSQGAAHFIQLSCVTCILEVQVFEYDKKKCVKKSHIRAKSDL